MQFYDGGVRRATLNLPSKATRAQTSRSSYEGAAGTAEIIMFRSWDAFWLACGRIQETSLCGKQRVGSGASPTFPALFLLGGRDATASSPEALLSVHGAAAVAR